MGMTLSEAAAVLGIEPTDDKAKINASYRAAVSKYHPDANRSKSPEEQKRAEAMFKKTGTARKVLLNPEMAEPEVEMGMPYDAASAGMGYDTGVGGGASGAGYANSSSRPRSTGGYQQAGGTSDMFAGQPRNQSSSVPNQRQNGQDSYRSSARADSTYQSPGYNTSKSFNDSTVERVADPAEESIAEIFRDEARSQYIKASDKFRMTPSAIVSGIFLLFAAVIFLASPLTINSFTPAAPAVDIAIVSIAKFIVYDLLISFYIHRFLQNRAGFGWSVLCGAEAIVMSVLSGIIIATCAVAAPVWALFAIGMLVLAGGGAIAIAGGVIMARKRDAERAAA